MQTETIIEYEARLKLFQSRTRVRARRVYIPAEDNPPRAPVATRSAWPMQIVVTVIGVALMVALVTFARNDIAGPLPAPDDAQRISFLSTEFSDVITD